MIGRRFGPTLVGLLIVGALLEPGSMSAAPVAVRYTEGLIHGFVVLRTLEGNILADGDWIQFARAGQVTARLLLHFKDGSLHDETTVFSEHRVFRLLTYHLVQKGPAFKHPMEVSIDGSKGQVTVRSSGDDGKEKTSTDRMDLPADVANGMVLVLLKNVRPDVPLTKMALVATAPKPRLVKLSVTPQGEEPFSTGDSTRKAMHYLVKAEIGGAAGLVAPLLGKRPSDIHVWILGGEAPTFLKSEGPLYFGGPIWRIELVSPVWPQAPGADSKH